MFHCIDACFRFLFIVPLEANHKEQKSHWFQYQTTDKNKGFMTDCGWVGSWILLYISPPPPFLKTDSIMFHTGPPGMDSPQAADLSRWWGPRCGRKDACRRSPGPGGVPHRRRTPPCAAFGWRYSGPARPGCSAAIPFPYLQRTETPPVEFRKRSVHYTYKCQRLFLAAELQICGFSHWPNGRIYIICNVGLLLNLYWVVLLDNPWFSHQPLNVF